jgi:hypothetical protein
MITRNGIYYDLSQSPYKIRISDTRLQFIFSSDLHMLKFKDKIMENRMETNARLTARYHIPVNFPVLADLILYQRIETRGYLVFNEKGVELCKESLILNGGIATLKD